LQESTGAPKLCNKPTLLIRIGFNANPLLSLMIKILQINKIPELWNFIVIPGSDKMPQKYALRL
jgi:hypothetical protein